MEISSVSENELNNLPSQAARVSSEAVEYAAQETTTVSFMTGHGPKRNFERVRGRGWLVVGGCLPVVPVDVHATPHCVAAT